MLLWGPPRVESSLAGDVVSTRRVVWQNQRQQIDYLRQVVTEYRSLYAIRSRARDIVFRQYSCAPRDQVAHALAIGSWVQRNITYVNELPEVFQTPTTTVAQGYGDCDDFVVLVAALIESVGVISEIVGMEWPERIGGREVRTFQHIFPYAVIPGRGRVPLDATLTHPVEERKDPVQLAIADGKKLDIYVR